MCDEIGHFEIRHPELIEHVLQHVLLSRREVALGLLLQDAENVDGLPRAHQVHISEEHTSELQSRPHLVCRLLLEKKKLLRHFFMVRRTLELLPLLISCFLWW